jgi:hypothetical protein
MKKVIKLTENDLSKIVKRVVNESLYENELHMKIMSVIKDSNASRTEVLDVLKGIANEMESGMNMRKDIKKRWDD